MLRSLFVMVALLFSNSAMAVFDMQAYAGKRSVDSLHGSSSDLSGMNYGAAFHFSPIPFVPVGLGMAAEYIMYDDLEFFNDVTGYLVIPQIYAWLPIGLLSVNPFVKLGYAFGAVTAEGSNNGISAKSAFKVSGTHMTAGVKWQPPVIPFLSLFFQYDFGFEKSSIVSVKLGGTEVDTSSAEKDHQNTAWHLGLELKI